MKRLVFSFHLFLVLFLLHGEDISFSPSALILQEEENSLFFSQGQPVEALNEGDSTVTLRLIPSREELRVEPDQIVLEKGDRGVFNLSWEGEIPPAGERIFSLIPLTKGGTAPSLYRIYEPSDYLVPTSTVSADEADVTLIYYYSPTCHDCRDFLEKEIPRLEEKLQITIAMEAVNVFDEAGMARLKARLAEAGQESDALPVLDTGEFLLTGDDMIREELESVLQGKKPGSPLERAASGKAPLWILVGGAGLLDGINPCAFSTLIFLLAYLGLRKGNRKEILQVGLFFTLTVFLTYTAVGAGAFLVLRQSLNFHWISSLLRWGGGIVLFALGALSLSDWFRVRRGRASDMTLQLSEKMKRAVHKSVRGGVRSTLPLIGACSMGFMVTIYELGCTGQIYLPTLYLMIQRGEGGGIILLLLYNLAFILPLGAVFFLSYRGMTSQRLNRWFQNRLALVKLITALFFWVAAGLVIFL
ncbi:MAG: hypothetical protein PQJ60_05715 [Spirochaetales bacterium]|nr:hypothetical protein [Spirochaetales bacterium]